MSKELNKQQSLAAVSLSDLIESALQLYGIPAMAVKRISGSRNMVTLAPFFAQELHPDSVDGGHLLLIGDAAMRVSSDSDLPCGCPLLSTATRLLLWFELQCGACHA